MTFEDETRYITEAIDAAQPIEDLRDAYQENFDDHPAYTKDNGGFVGGTLLNIVTGAYYAMREGNVENGFTEKPVIVKDTPTSFIGAYTLNLLNGYNEQGIKNTNTSLEFGQLIGRHFCNKAERFYNGELYEDDYDEYNRAHIFVDRGDKPVLYQKSNGCMSALVLDKDGIDIDKAWLPPGTIVALSRPHIRSSLNDTNLTVRSTRLITHVAPLRLSLFAIPQTERPDTFRTPLGHEGAGFTAGEFMPEITMTDINEVVLAQKDKHDNPEMWGTSQTDKRAVA